jgi:two-component system NarL family sensor kinase
MFSALANNILKHSNAENATIQVIIDEEQLLLMVEDDGIGFDVQEKHEGIGLDNIQRRVSRFKGKLYVTSDARSGTTVIITIPKPK